MPLVRTVRPDGGGIRARRIRLGLTPSQFAAKIGRHRQTIQQIESGRIEAASEVLISQIALALGVEPAEIIKRNGNGAAA
ncbi:MAG: helix-turn-helix transcriptional regulator [Actinobacteria bacterium]|nr:helix-turn-helix transcriptional regulator [Actinomycetota bacterium]